MAYTPPGDTRRKVYRYVRQRLVAGEPPTIREVQEAFGFRSVESARSHLEELARRLTARSEESAVVWCNGRTGAQGFYQRQRFSPIGDLFETPGTGPHYVFWRRVAAE